MKAVTVINRLVIKPGKLEEFFEAQQEFAARLPPCGLIGGRMYRGGDGQSAVLVSIFESRSAQEEVFQRADLKENMRKLQPLVESSSPTVYEEVYTYGDFK
jgi:hypothetical protein